MSEETELALMDMKRLLHLYGPFHPYCQKYADTHRNLKGFVWAARWLFVKSFFGVL